MFLNFFWIHYIKVFRNLKFSDFLKLKFLNFLELSYTKISLKKTCVAEKLRLISYPLRFQSASRPFELNRLRPSGSLACDFPGSSSFRNILVDTRVCFFECGKKAFLREWIQFFFSTIFEMNDIFPIEKIEVAKTVEIKFPNCQFFRNFIIFEIW